MATARKNSKSATDASASPRGAQGGPPCGQHASRELEGSPRPRPRVSTPCVNPNPRWRACITGQKRYVPLDEHQRAKRRDRARLDGKSAEEVAALKDFIVTSSRFAEIHHEGYEPVRFRINRQKSGHITFTDRRECETGIGGTTGLWRTLPPMQAGLPRSLTPNAFKAELGRLVGIETAEQVIREITQGDFFSTKK